MGTLPTKCRYSDRHEILCIFFGGLILTPKAHWDPDSVSFGPQHLFREVLEDHSGQELRQRFLKGKARNENFLL